MLNLYQNNAFASGMFIWSSVYISLLSLKRRSEKEKLRNSVNYTVYKWLCLQKLSLGVMKSQASKFIFENYQECLLRDSLGSFKVDCRVKDLLCMIRLYQSTCKPTRHFLVLWERDVDAGIVRVILLFYWFSLCCRSMCAIGQSWDVVIHRTRRRLTGREDRVVHLENTWLLNGCSEAHLLISMVCCWR